MSTGDGRKEVDLGLVVLDLMEQALAGGLFSDDRRQTRFKFAVLQYVFRRARDFLLQVLDHLPEVFARDLHLNPASGPFAQWLRDENAGHLDFSF
ncbi:MAG: hypothetical protein IIC29_01585 [Chloroflexi bacterium]|nr:hypothetical protein [Chloroflexota bacterium]MCH8234798.1 hypothetical protein [Chloroflexota bacterium]MCH8816142.1 hypothetical protein [Chloroflexota bacterium]